MSKRAIKYAKALANQHYHRSPLPALLIKREVTVLKALATWYNDDLRCAYPSLASLAIEAHMSERSCQRGLAGLELKGILRRLPGQAVRNGSQTSNEFEFPELGLVNENDKVQAAARKRMFTLPRSRMMPLQLSLVPKEVPVTVYSAGVVGGRSSVSDDSAELDGDLVSVSPAGLEECAVSEDSAACGNGVLVSPGGCQSVAPGVSPCHPVELYDDMNGDEEEPISSLGDADEVQKLPEHRRAKATARTTANAKTGASEAQRVPAERGGRTRQPRLGRGVRVEDLRAKLDGEDVAFFDEVLRVLKCCGIAPERCNRNLRESLEDALRLRVEMHGCSVSDAGMLAVERLRGYRDVGWALTIRYSPTTFFRDGHWLLPDMWAYDRAAVERKRMGGESTIGMHRPAAE